ncbi:MAG: N-acetylmuramoyl-L-alanine amidase, partial [Bacteriovoracaceae bacterium]|nr:N-acetylmuramoyl-L-alanine amidase [Bacteriovoracaceae bacterium]
MNNSFEPYQEKYTAQEITERLNILLQDKSLFTFFDITPHNLTIKNKNQEPFLSIRLREDALPKPIFKPRRIAIDAGHSGGPLEDPIECKFIYDANKKRKLEEQEINLYTATILKKLLEQNGIEVLLTRTKPYELVSNADHYNRNIELAARAKKINDFKPDLTFVIHYNLTPFDHTVDPTYTEWTEKNYSMVFIAGAYENNLFLDHPDFFLKRLLSHDLTHSEQISQKIISLLEKNLSIPPVAFNEETAPYLQKFSCETKYQGVFSRGLSLLQNV